MSCPQTNDLPLDSMGTQHPVGLLSTARKMSLLGWLHNSERTGACTSFFTSIFPVVLLSDRVLCSTGAGLRPTLPLRMIWNFWPPSLQLLSVGVTVYLVLGGLVKLSTNWCLSTGPLHAFSASVSPTFSGYHPKNRLGDVPLSLAVPCVFTVYLSHTQFLLWLFFLMKPKYPFHSSVHFPHTYPLSCSYSYSVIHTHTYKYEHTCISICIL